MDDFWQKWQAYSLTFGPKLAVLRHFLICGRIWRKLKMVTLGQNNNPIALCFGQIWPFQFIVKES